MSAHSRTFEISEQNQFCTKYIEVLPEDASGLVFMEEEISPGAGAHSSIGWVHDFIDFGTAHAQELGSKHIAFMTAQGGPNKEGTGYIQAWMHVDLAAIIAFLQAQEFKKSFFAFDAQDMDLARVNKYFKSFGFTYSDAKGGFVKKKIVVKAKKINGNVLNSLKSEVMFYALRAVQHKYKLFAVVGIHKGSHIEKNNVIVMLKQLDIGLDSMHGIHERSVIETVLTQVLNRNGLLELTAQAEETIRKWWDDAVETQDIGPVVS